MGRGPSSVLGVSGNYSCLTFRGPWAGRPTAMQLTAGAVFNGWVLARCSLAGLCTASPPWPIRAETGCEAGFSESCMFNFLHGLIPPFMGSYVHH